MSWKVFWDIEVVLIVSENWTVVIQNLIISMIFADLVQLESGCCYLWFWEPLIILIKISLLLIQ